MMQPSADVIPGIERHESRLQTDIADQRAHMECAAAPERHCREPRGIMPPLDRYEPDRTGHLGIRHAHDGFCCGFCCKTQWFTDMGLDGAASGVDVEARQSSAVIGRSALIRPRTRWHRSKSAAYSHHSRPDPA